MSLRLQIDDYVIFLVGVHVEIDPFKTWQVQAQFNGIENPSK